MSKTVKYPLPVTGVDLLSSETSLQKGAVRSAVNVDIGRAGDFSRRRGFARIKPGVGFHSIYRFKSGDFTVVCQGSVLYRLNNDMSTVQLAQLNSPDQVAYVEYNGTLYFTNRTSTGAVLPGGLAKRVGVLQPTPPVLSATAGSLPPGRYGVTVTSVDNFKEESGTCAYQIINLPNGGGIRLTGLPVVDASWQSFIYITATDGETLRLAATPPAIFPSYVVGDIPTGAECNTHGLVPLPAGDFACWHSGRLYTARDGVLRFSEALRPSLHDPAHGVIPFTGPISFIERVVDGIYVGDRRGVWFLGGMDPVKFDIQLVSPLRAITRSSTTINPENFPDKVIASKNPVAVWLSTQGYVAGMESGVTVPLQPDRVLVPAGQVGRTAFLVRNGMKQLVTPVNSTSTAVIGTADNSTT